MRSLVLLALTVPFVAFARDRKHVAPPPQPVATPEHCHTKDDAGNLVDAKEMKTEKVCDEKGGSWFQHHAHCHKPDANGKQADVTDVKTENECTSRGGTWTDHGHESEPAPGKTK